MKKLVILRPPRHLEGAEAVAIRAELAAWAKRSGDPATLVVEPGWTLDVIEGDDVRVELAKPKRRARAS